MGPAPGFSSEDESALERHKYELLGRFASDIVHDFNNVLTAILGTAALLKESGGLSDVQLGDVREIERSGRRAADLARQVLDYSRRRGREPSPEDVNAVVRGVELLLTRLLRSDMSLVLRLEPGLPRVLVQKGRLEQVLLNLTANARDAMPQGGTLTVSTARSEGGVLLEVSDTGTGMSEEVLARIFDPYFTTKEEGQGCGLGLAIVQGIVRGWGGSVGVKSRPGEGTRFSLRLPASPGEAR